jgi:RNA 3'-terminal phosphate cyclase (ATP)
MEAGSRWNDRRAMPDAMPEDRFARKRWATHAPHDGIPPPIRVSWNSPWNHRQQGDVPLVPASTYPYPSESMVDLDGSHGEGGGQILRTALSLSLLTGRPFRMTSIRANRDKPGLRPQHLKAVEAAALLGHAEVTGAVAGSRVLVFRPGAYSPSDLTVDIGTAGSTSLVLQTLHLPLAMRAESAVRIILTGGTFNPKAPAHSFLEHTWRAYLAAFGLPIALAMPAAGFYPRGGGRLEAWIEPATPRAWIQTSRGSLLRILGIAGVANLRDSVAERLRDRALQRLREDGLTAPVEIETVRWPSPGQGAALSLIAEYENAIPATFVGLSQRGKPSEEVADLAVDQLLAFEAVGQGAVDPHSADQILLPLSLAEGRSIYTVSEITNHLRTNAATIISFLDRPIMVEEPGLEGQPGRVIVG